MRYAKDRKEQTRRNILISACRRFAAQGFAATSIDQIMHDCKLTRGGFYAHFKSKSELYRDSIALATSQRKAARRNDDNWIEAIFDEHLQAEETAFFATDVASNEPEVRGAYTQAFNSMSQQIAAKIAMHRSCAEETALALTAMMIGAIAVARTTDDGALKETLVAACKVNARTLLDGSGDALTFFWEPPTQHERARYRVRGTI
jgi:AcrR family transcriptional regulator